MLGTIIGMLLVWLVTISPLVASIAYKPISKKSKLIWITVSVVVPAIVLGLALFIVDMFF